MGGCEHGTYLGKGEQRISYSRLFREQLLLKCLGNRESSRIPPNKAITDSHVPVGVRGSKARRDSVPLHAPPANDAEGCDSPGS